MYTLVNAHVGADGEPFAAPRNDRVETKAHDEKICLDQSCCRLKAKPRQAPVEELTCTSPHQPSF